MSDKRMHMNKMGLVDFWCYENEVFDFVDGHMLLRGSNGSGKSVTMQSFIPLLLDGNKSSERLDPFGTRSRKMDTYLINEESNRDERIGYLYLEFKNDDRYITIGMGLRARKAKPLQSWYFVIEDNKRVNVDFSLMENHLTLTEKQLRNIIGDQVISSQREYMSRVNDALFGFESLDDYSDAISLLLQLRSPKLSNSLSPAKINEILGQSLQPLSDEELRPMSEAIVNMDTLQDQLESLKQSYDAALKIEQAYKLYNQAFLLEKWDKYNNEKKELNRLQLSFKDINKQITNYSNDIDNNQKQYDNNNIEKEIKINELNTLKDNDIDKWLNDIEIYIKDIENNKKELNKKEKLFEQNEEIYIDLRNNIKEYQDKIDYQESNSYKALKQMNTINESINFMENIAINECFENRKKDYNFTYSRNVIKKEIAYIDEGMKKWHDYDNQNIQLDFYEQQLLKQQNEIDNNYLKIEEAKKDYRLVIDKYNEFYHQYNEFNKVLNISNEQVEYMIEQLVDYENSHNYSNIKGLVEKIYQDKSSNLLSQIIELKHQIELIENDILVLIEQRDELINSKDLTPKLSNEQLFNRQCLDNLNIDYIPLYKVLDFDNNLNEDSKNRIEEILLQMNLLDALIINLKDKDNVINLPLGGNDYYLWTNLKLEDINTINISNDFSSDELERILHDLGINNEGLLVIEERYFKSGIIEGTISLSQRATYIGYKQRLLIKQEKIELLNSQIDNKKISKDALINKRNDKQSLQDILINEYKQFIDEQQIKDSLKIIDDLKDENNRLELLKKGIEKNILEENKKINIILQDIKEISDKLNIKCQKIYFKEYRDDFIAYQEEFEVFKESYSDLINSLEIMEHDKDRYNQIELTLDDVKYDIDQLVHKIKLVKGKKEALQSQLDQAGYTDIMQRTLLIQERIEEIETINKELNDSIIRNSANIDHLKNESKEIEVLINNQREKEQIYKNIFNQELDYHFIIKDNNNIANDMKDLSLKLSQRKNISDYQNTLQHVYFEQYNYLSQFNIYQESVDLCNPVDDIANRIILKGINQGKKIPFLDLLSILNDNIEMQKLLIDDEDRHIFEEILVNTIGKKIRERIQVSRRWVEKMQRYMNDMNTSSGLQLSLQWKSRKANDDEQLDTKQLVELLEKDFYILKDSDRRKISNHFRSKISFARKMSEDENTTASFHQLMKDVMDYRQWFDFTLFAKKPNENKKELTSHIFYAYSGGEKALSMYVPLFSAVAAKFESARDNAPILIALDEAFAGVDENNIDNMFALITKFGFDYIMNSQSLWGDYPSCKSLAIYELFRPNNAPFVTVIAYVWNGHKRVVKLT